ncbi:unnamed protein product, partial [Amoebophrya sp. A25]|eukprot:GSA25T00027335001.1
MTQVPRRTPVLSINEAVSLVEHVKVPAQDSETEFDVTMGGAVKPTEPFPPTVGELLEDARLVRGPS